MSGSDLKYGAVTTEKKEFHPGEPVFVLRAADFCAPGAISRYSDLCIRLGCTEEHVKAIGVALARFVEWQRANPQLVKQPD